MKRRWVRRSLIALTLVIASAAFVSILARPSSLIADSVKITFLSFDKTGQPVFSVVNELTNSVYLDIQRIEIKRGESWIEGLGTQNINLVQAEFANPKSTRKLHVYLKTPMPQGIWRFKCEVSEPLRGSDKMFAVATIIWRELMHGRLTNPKEAYGYQSFGHFTPVYSNVVTNGPIAGP